MTANAPYSLALALALGCSLSCERITRAQQCVELVETVNSTMHAIATHAGATDQDDAESFAPQRVSAGHLRASAALYTGLAEQLGPMEFSDRQMALDVEAFRRTLTQAAHLCEKLATAQDENERATAASLRKELVGLRAALKGSAYKMNHWCHQP